MYSSCCWHICSLYYLYFGRSDWPHSKVNSIKVNWLGSYWPHEVRTVRSKAKYSDGSTNGYWQKQWFTSPRPTCRNSDSHHLRRLALVWPAVSELFVVLEFGAKPSVFLIHLVIFNICVVLLLLVSLKSKGAITGHDNLDYLHLILYFVFPFVMNSFLSQNLLIIAIHNHVCNSIVTTFLFRFTLVRNLSVMVSNFVDWMYV